MEIKIQSVQPGIEQMIAKINQMGQAANDKCYQIVKDLTHALEEGVVERMPVDESFLESSTKTKVMKNQDVDKITGIVFIPSNAPASDYALYMHEMTYSLGERSARKQASTNIEVGRKYFERALKDKTPGFQTYIFRQLKGFVDNVK